ncbi:MAG TPA: ATP-binding protein [Candidatus Limnocylindrales bacterium]|nr:ATP-binding protein [Candidatus Limnocylindrales bacterium]
MNPPHDPPAPVHDERRLGPDGRLVVDLVGVAVLHVDQDHVVDEANLAARMLLRPSRGDVLGRTVMEVFLDRHVDDLIEAATATTTATIETSLRSADVRDLVIRARRAPDGGTWLAVEDVSELRRLQLIRAEFIGNLSHELRTPVTNVGLLAETLARDVDAAGDAVPAKVRERVARIEIEAGHLGQMIAEMLDLSRIESGGPMVLIDELDPAALAASVAERLHVYAERQAIALAVEVDGDVPTVRGDEDRLAQALVNLVHNAIKFSPDGAPVVIRVARRGPDVAIAVTDEGPGIPADARTRIFERFYKVDRSRARGGGTGLGLAIARHIVEGHGGRIELESREDRGSTFTVVLPVAVGPSGDRLPGAPGPAGHSEGPR